MLLYNIKNSLNFSPLDVAKSENTTEGFDDNYDDHNRATAACNDIPKKAPSGIPDYIASGSHYFGNARYRFLVLPRFDRDLHSLIKKCRVHQKSVLTLAIQIINVLENLHDKGYCHNDVKAQNLMISKCKYLTQRNKMVSLKNEPPSYPNGIIVAGGKQCVKSSTKYDDHYDEKQQTTDSGNSSEQEANDEDDEDFVVKRKVYGRDYEGDESQAEEDEDEEDEDFDDGATSNSTNSNSMDTYHTPLNKNKRQSEKKTTRTVVQYSGSNPVRSCRREKPNSIYDEMVKSHYLRPTKRISYSEFFNEDGVSVKSHSNENSNSASDMHSNSSDDDSEEFVPLYVRRSIKSSAKKSYSTNMNSRRLTRRQEKLLGINNTRNRKVSGEVEDENKKKLKIEKYDNSLSQEHNKPEEWFEVNEERIFLIDYGLASKFIDNGVHRPFVMDQRRAHDGTLEFTSRDAHMGAHSRRSDMECLGYNLLFWSQGYLPWKETATNQQQEKVHRAKEFLMTDVRELLRQIYGKQVPKYLGEYLHLVGQLAYHERPDYSRYRRIFEREYQQLGYSLHDMRLQMHEIQRTCVRVKEEIENKNDFFESNKNNGACNMVMNIMQNLSVGGTPFHERTLSNRVSPKNLRSKSDKKASKKKKFSWTEILSQDPDQIARERAEKEFDREEELSDVQQPIVRRYQGKPTNAIRVMLALLGRSVSDYETETLQLEKNTKQKYHKNENEVSNLLRCIEYHNLVVLINKCFIFIQMNMEIDECDNGKKYSNRLEAMDEDCDEDGDRDDEHDIDYNDQSGDEDETDATESSDQYTKRKTTVQRQQQQQANNKRSKISASRKLILKTPNMTPASGNNTSVSVTPIGRRTRGKKAATLKNVTSSSISKSKAKITKSTKKAGCRTKTSARKSSFSASAAGEIEQQTSAIGTTRERRTRRCLIKTDLTTPESLQEDDSNSNFSPDVKGLLWKYNNTESMHSRNYKK